MASVLALLVSCPVELNRDIMILACIILPLFFRIVW